MKEYTQYSLRTGKIIGTLSLPETDEAYDMHSVALVDGTYDGENYYVQDGVITERFEMELSLSRDTLSIANEEFTSITGIPFGATLTLSHPELGTITQTVNSTDYLYKPQVPGVFTFTFSCFPYKDKTLQVTAYSLEL
jgi:hypothetical protein